MFSESHANEVNQLSYKSSNHDCSLINAIADFGEMKADANRHIQSVTMQHYDILLADSATDDSKE